MNNKIETNKTIIEQIKDQQIELTKTNVEKFANQIVFEFQTGNKNSFSYLGELEFISQAIEKAKSEIRESLIDELHLYKDKATTKNGIQFKLKEAGVKYDFKNTEKWNTLNEEAEAIKAEMKSLEAQLKAIKSKQTIVDESTGELIEMNVPIKSSKTTIEITIPK